MAWSNTIRKARDRGDCMQSPRLCPANRARADVCARRPTVDQPLREYRPIVTSLDKCAEPICGVTTNRIFPPSNFLSNVSASKIFSRGKFVGNCVGKSNLLQKIDNRIALIRAAARLFHRDSAGRDNSKADRFAVKKFADNLRRARSRDQQCDRN